jgi:hypothetical protein
LIASDKLTMGRAVTPAPLVGGDNTGPSGQSWRIDALSTTDGMSSKTNGTLNVL